MKVAKLHMERIAQETHVAGGDGGHMRSRVFFSYEYGDRVTSGLSSIIKQTSGSDYSKDSLEVSMPEYEGPFNYLAFRDAVEHYYRNSIGNTIAFDTGSTGSIEMSNNTFFQTIIYEIPVGPS